MSHDLSLAQSNAFELAHTLMVPVTLFLVDGEYGVMLSDELPTVLTTSRRGPSTAPT